jgi:hypothetical protein
MAASGVLGAGRWLWDRVFGPPRVRELPDGSVRVRLLGRVFEAADYEGLMGAVSREREYLLRAAARVHEGAGHRATLSVSRLGPGDLYFREVQRIEDRLAVYNEFLGHMVQRLQQQRQP